MTSPSLRPSDVLSEIRRMLEVEIVSQPATGTIEISRSGVVLCFAALAEVAAEVEVLEESAGAADRLHRELDIARAENAQLQQQLLLAESTRTGGIRFVEPARRPRRVAPIRPFAVVEGDGGAA